MLPRWAAGTDWSVAAAGTSTGLAGHTMAAALELGVILQTAPAVLNGVRSKMSQNAASTASDSRSGVPVRNVS